MKNFFKTLVQANSAPTQGNKALPFQAIPPRADEYGVQFFKRVNSEGQIIDGTPQISEIALISSEFTNTTFTTADITNNNYKGIRVIHSIESDGVIDFELKIEGKDLASGDYYDLITTGTLTGGIGKHFLFIYPGVNETANEKLDNYLPKTFRINLIRNSGGENMSLGYTLLP